MVITQDTNHGDRLRIVDWMYVFVAFILGGIIFYASAQYAVPKLKPHLAAPADRGIAAISQTQPILGVSNYTVTAKVPATMRASQTASASLALVVHCKPPVFKSKKHAPPEVFFSSCSLATSPVALSSTKGLDIRPQGFRSPDQNNYQLTWDIEGERLGVFIVRFEKLEFQPDLPFTVIGDNDVFEIRSDHSLAAHIKVLSPAGITAENMERLKLAKDYSFGIGALLSGGIVLLWRRARNKKHPAGWI